MKLSNKILLGLFAAIALNVLTGMVMVRSSLGPSGIGNGDNYIKGTGASKKIKLTTGDYSEVYIDGNYHINLIQGDEYVEIEAQESIVDYFELEKGDGKTISINVKDGYTIQPTDRVTITIGFKNLEKINSYGAAKFFSQKTLEFDGLFIGLNGASYIETPLTAKNLRLELNGASNANLSGNAPNLNAILSGGCNLHANGLEVQKTYVVLSGASYADLTVTEYLNANTSGGSSVEYAGNPKVDQHSSGASRINKK